MTVEWRPEDPPILVFAGSPHQAEYWARHVAKLPSRQAYRYVDNLQDLRNRKGGKALIVGTFWDRHPDTITDLLEYTRVMDLEWLRPYDVR